MSFAYWSKNDLPDIRRLNHHDQGERQRAHNSPTGVKSKFRKSSALDSLQDQGHFKVKMDVDVDNDLQCPICLELYTYPIILPCSHVLCRRPCAEQLFDFNFIRCPVCRDNCYVSGGISSLPRVIALENIIERYKNERKKEKHNTTTAACEKEPENKYSSQNTAVSPVLSKDIIHCQKCTTLTPKPAKKSCLTCNSHFCASCLRISHPNREPFTEHEFVEPVVFEEVSKLHTVKGCKTASGANVGGVCGLGRTPLVDKYCQLCNQPFSSHQSDTDLHQAHPVVPVEEAYTELKDAIESNAEKLETSQDKVVTCLKDQKDGLKDLQQVLNRRRDEINTQCDALLAEVENKRGFFLADLEYEERVHQNSMDDSVKTLEKMAGSTSGLKNYVNEVLMSTDRRAFLEVARTLNDRLLKATLDCENSPSLMVDVDTLHNKVVDCRKEKALLRDLHYLNPPSTPIVDVTRCSRSEDAVVLALCPSKNLHDLVDQYEVHFCSEAQKNIELEETLLVKNCPEDTGSNKMSTTSTGILVILIDNLCKATTYYFCLSASNTAGKSASSEVVQCTTLPQGDNVIPEPVILESLCKCHTSSIQIYSSSPIDVAAEQKISHFLLHRQPSLNRAWKCVSMYAREEHRVFGLESSTDYEFTILAYNLRGECRVSNKVRLQTEPTSSPY